MKSKHHLPYPAGINHNAFGAIEFRRGKTDYRIELFPHYIEHDIASGVPIIREQRLVWNAWRSAGDRWKPIPGFTRSECAAFPRIVSDQAREFYDITMHAVCWP